MKKRSPQVSFCNYFSHGNTDKATLSGHSAISVWKENGWIDIIEDGHINGTKIHKIMITELGLSILEINKL